MPVPQACRNPACPNHWDPAVGWKLRYGVYRTSAHGTVQRYQCRCCRRTTSEQSESLHYYAKRRVPLEAVWLSLLGGASLREIARRYHLHPPTIQNTLLRLGRQAMSAQLHLLALLKPCSAVVYDGLRSFLSSQDYPCDITAVAERRGEVVLSMVHSISSRGGRMNEKQRRRVEAKRAAWSSRAGSTREAISLLQREIWDYLRAPSGSPASIDTDENPLYAAQLLRDPVAVHLRACRQLVHGQTSSTLPRTVDNPLFPLNYLDRLLRHRLKEHTRETLAFGRNSTLQMHRAWIFAYDHNCRREYRVKRPHCGTHAEQAALEAEEVRRVNRQFFQRRIKLRGLPLPETIRRVWMAELPTPPVRWKAGQRGTSVRVTKYAERDLRDTGYHQGR